MEIASQNYTNTNENVIDYKVIQNTERKLQHKIILIQRQSWIVIDYKKQHKKRT